MKVVHDGEKPPSEPLSPWPGLPQMSSPERAFEAVLDQIVGTIRISEQRPGVAAEPGDVGQELGSADHADAIRPSAVPHSTDIRRPRLDALLGAANRPFTPVNEASRRLFRPDRIFLAAPIGRTCICSRKFPTRKSRLGESPI